MFFRVITFFLLLRISTTSLFAQITGPEQDCDDALPVCQDTFIQDNTYQGNGLIEDIPSRSSCLENEENNSVWYIFTVTDSGFLEFDIGARGASAQDTVDYDFALYNITGTGCAGIHSGIPPVRCNYAFTDSVTGLRAGYTDSVANSTGDPFCSPLWVHVGETYALVVDNFSSLPFGYKLDFRPSTAGIKDTVPPVIAGVDNLPCDYGDSLTVHLSEPVLCTSLAADGSDFLITGPSAVAISGAYGTACSSGRFTQSVILKLAAPISAGGSYNILLVQGSDGNTTEDNCFNRPQPGFSFPFFVPEKVTASFGYTKLASCRADTFVFNNTSSASPTISYLWDFGDMTTSTLQHPVHWYSVVDTYTVSLTVSSNECTATFVNSNIQVTNDINLIITYDPAYLCVGVPVNFRDSSGYTSAAAHRWEFGNGDFSNQQNPTHTYTDDGSYTVKLVIIDNTAVPACSDSTTRTVLVHENADADFMYDDPPCAGVPVNFTDASTGSPVRWTWTFPDGSTTAGPTASFIFDTAGTYAVQLSVEDQFCLPDAVTKDVDVRPRPVFDLGDNTGICLPETIDLFAYPNADSYLWSTGATTSSIEFGEVPGTVWARATLNQCEYADTIFIDEKIEGCSFALVPSAFSPNDDSKNDLLNVLTKRVLEYEIIIYNRWGEEVFRGTSNDTGWDGTYKDEPQDIGVYTYIITYTPYSGKPQTRSGTITLVR